MHFAKNPFKNSLKCNKLKIIQYFHGESRASRGVLFFQYRQLRSFVTSFGFRSILHVTCSSPNG